MIECMTNIEAEIRCRYNHERALSANPRDLARGAIWRIRNSNKKAGLSQVDPKGNKPFVQYALDLLNIAQEKDPQNIRRYARIRAIFYESEAEVQRKSLQAKGIADDYQGRLAKWDAEKEAALTGGYYRAIGFACLPEDQYYYARDNEATAKVLRDKYGLKSQEEVMKGGLN